MTQEEAAAVELYADTAGGLYIFPEGEENGFYMTADVPGGLFKNDARDIAGGGVAQKIPQRHCSLR
jgi:hypothetical protein